MGRYYEIQRMQKVLFMTAITIITSPRIWGGKKERETGRGQNVLQDDQFTRLKFYVHSCHQYTSKAYHAHGTTRKPWGYSSD